MSFPVKATCTVGPEGRSCDGSSRDTGVSGTVHFVQNSPASCKISWNITGLTPGKHGFHVHELADFSNGCKSAKGHYNPYGATHGGPNDEAGKRHVGDLGNITAGPNGVAKGSMEDHLVKLVGPTSVIGRSIMVHAGEDDLGKGGNADSLKTGNAGGRVACGEIFLVPKPSM